MKETDSGQGTIGAPLHVSAATDILAQFLEQHRESLTGILRTYVRKANPVQDGNNAEIQEAAVELLHEVTVEAFKASARFDPARSPQAWLLGIAAKLVMRKKAELAKRHRHETLLGELQAAQQAEGSDEDLLDRLVPASSPGAEMAEEGLPSAGGNERARRGWAAWKQVHAWPWLAWQ